MDNDLMFERMLGKYKPIRQDGAFTRTFSGNWYLIGINGDLSEYFNETVGNSDLEDIIDQVERKKLPEDNGVYLCEFEYYTHQSNSPMDPEEWDENITIHNISKVSVDNFHKFAEIMNYGK